MAEYRTEAIVLNRTDQGEADRWVTCYTKEFGKLELFAKGAQKILAKLSPHLEPFTHADISFATGKSKNTLTNVLEIESFAGLRRSPEKIATATKIVELLQGTVKQPQKDPELWDLCLGVLRAINAFPNEQFHSPHSAVVTLFFEYHLLRILGYEPPLDPRDKLLEEFRSRPLTQFAEVTYPAEDLEAARDRLHGFLIYYLG